MRYTQPLRSKDRRSICSITEFSPVSIFADFFNVGGVGRQKRSIPHFSLLTEKPAKFKTGEYSPMDHINLQILMSSLAARLSKR